MVDSGSPLNHHKPSVIYIYILSTPHWWWLVMVLVPATPFQSTIAMVVVRAAIINYYRPTNTWVCVSTQQPTAAWCKWPYGQWIKPLHICHWPCLFGATIQTNDGYLTTQKIRTTSAANLVPLGAMGPPHHWGPLASTPPEEKRVWLRTCWRAEPVTGST